MITFTLLFFLLCYLLGHLSSLVFLFHFFFVICCSNSILLAFGCISFLISVSDCVCHAFDARSVVLLWRVPTFYCVVMSSMWYAALVMLCISPSRFVLPSVVVVADFMVSHFLVCTFPLFWMPLLYLRNLYSGANGMF